MKKISRLMTLMISILLILPLFRVTIKAEEGKFTFDGQIVWINDKEEYRPSEIAIDIYRNDEYLQQYVTNAELDWTYHFEDALPEDSSAIQYKFSLKTNGGNIIKYDISIDNYNFVLTRRPEKITLHMLDMGAESFVGANAYITNELGEVVYDFVSDEGGGIQMELLPGAYEFHLREVPEGFIPVNDFGFVVNGDGQVEVQDANGNVTAIEGNYLGIVVKPVIADEPEPEPEPTPEPEPEPTPEPTPTPTPKPSDTTKPSRDDAVTPYCNDKDDQVAAQTPTVNTQETTPAPYVQPTVDMAPAILSTNQTNGEAARDLIRSSEMKESEETDNKKEVEEKKEEREVTPETYEVAEGAVDSDVNTNELLGEGGLGSADLNKVDMIIMIPIALGMLAILVYGVVVLLQLRKNPFEM